MSKSDHQPLGDRLVEAYHRMLDRLREGVEQAEKNAAPAVQEGIENAKRRAAELGELSREEAEKVGAYLRHDLRDAADFLASSGKELRDWLQFDLTLVERSLAEMFATAVDQTRVELDRWSRRAEEVGEWHTGEVTGIGTLQCKSCGELLRFHRIAHIPPCPQCHGTRFRRVTHGE